jgi:hypothetical protein
MAGRPPLDYDQQDLLTLLGKHGSWAEIARAEGINPNTLRNHASKIGVTIAGARAEMSADASKAKNDGGHFITSDDPEEWGDVESLLERRGLRRNDWIILRARVNEWGGPDGQDNAQLRIDLSPRMGLLMPARSEGWIPPRKPEPQKSKDHEMVVFLGDHHAPHHDEALHVAVCEWLREFQPDRGILLGDLLDFDQLSRHRRTPEWTAGVQHTLDSAYSILRAYIEASPGTRWQMLDGNHEDRLRNSVLDHLSQMFGVTRAKEDQEEDQRPVLSTPFLLRLDELGIEWESPTGGYEHAQINITSELAARHGWLAKKGSGSSALGTIDHLRYSVVIGHTHRQAIVHHTAHSIDGRAKTLLGCEAGTLAAIEGGLGYANAPDWQRGFAVADIYSGSPGLFKVDLATFVDGTLLWRDWICRP